MWIFLDFGYDSSLQEVSTVLFKNTRLLESCKGLNIAEFCYFQQGLFLYYCTIIKSVLFLACVFM